MLNARWVSAEEMHLSLSTATFCVVGGVIQDCIENKILVIFFGGVNNLIFSFQSAYSQLVVYAILAGASYSDEAVICVIPQYPVIFSELSRAFLLVVLVHCQLGRMILLVPMSDTVFFVAGGLSSLLMFSDICLRRRRLRDECPNHVVTSLESSV